MNGPWLNEFTCEWWRGNEDRSLAPDYVTRISFAFTGNTARLSGRINGAVTEDQEALKALRAEITQAVFAR